MVEACKAVKAAKVKYRRTGVPQQVSFRSRREPDPRFGFDAVSLKAASVFSREHALTFLPTEAIPSAMLEGTKVVYKSGRWFLIVPVNVPRASERDPSLPVVAIDPGVRCFVTFYSEAGVGQIGKGDFGQVHRLCKHLDSLMSRIAAANSKAKMRMIKAANRMRWRIKDLIRDLHAKTACFFSRSFSRIFLPTFETSKMVTRLASKTARMMLTFSHFAFRQAMQSACEKTGAILEIVSEAYTSRTCSYCGKMHNKNSKPVIKCCGGIIDRDLNGARGIYLRALRASSCGTPVPLHCN